MTNPRNHPKGIWHKEQNLTKISGRFAVTGAPAIGVVTGHGFAITRTGAGDYLVTFTDGFTHLLQGQVGVAAISGAAVDMYGQLGVFTPGAAGACTLQIRTKTGAVTTEVAATDSVHFEVTLYGEDLEGY